MASRNQKLLELVGPLLPRRDQEEEGDDCGTEEEEEEGEEQEDTEFLDAEELCSGGCKAGGLPGRRHVIIHDENTQKQFKVFGRFPITGPWWRVKVQAKPARSKIYQVQGFPSYFLRSDLSPPDQNSICALFLKECEVPPEEVKQFLAWVTKKASSYEDLRFENLKETLRSFYQEIRKKDKKQFGQNEQQELLPGNEIRLPMEHRIPFINVMNALNYPKIMEFLLALLPRHFNQLITTGSKEVLEAIEKILGTQPWKLGFSRVTYRELKLLRCEASGMAFSQCPSLLELMTDVEKNALDLYSKLKHVCREDGHTYLEKVSLTLKVHYDVWQSLEFLRDIGVVTFVKDCVSLYELYQAESIIASLVCDLMMKPPWHLDVDVRKVLASIHTTKRQDSGSKDAPKESNPDETSLDNSIDTLELQDRGEENDSNAEMKEVQLDQDQVAALEMICSNAVTVISGKGGCGKTTIVSHLFKYIEQLEEREVRKACEDFEQDQDVPEEWMTFTGQGQLGADKPIEVLLTAPTGKAAGLLREKTGLLAYTLYQVNYSFYFWKNMKNDKPWKFSSVTVLVVDEGSLVSVGIFKLKPRKCAIELRTNHRAESQLIVDSATRISERRLPTFDLELNISENSTFPISIQDKTFIFVRLPEEGASTQASQDDQKFYLYSAVKALLQENDFKSPETSQFIAFRRDHRKKVVFGVGDKICCTRNAYLSELLPGKLSETQPNSDLQPNGEGFCGTPSDFAKNKHEPESDIRLCNGEIFFIRNDVTDVTHGKRRHLTINNMAGLEVTVDFKKLMKHCAIKHAWARTIHTFQGSEERTVAYVVGKAGRQHWQHVYTAVTRGRCRVYVIAEQSQLLKAIRRPVLLRKTHLKHFLQDELAVRCASPVDHLSQPASSGDSGGPSLPTTPLPKDATTTIADDVAKSQSSFADVSMATPPRRWQFTSFEEGSTDEDFSPSPGSKRTPRMDICDSLNKVCKVEEASPQVSSQLQNLRLNKLIPKQLFRPTKDQENFTSDGPK
ncbi:DNA helicase B [Octodon degus]|uniref:DNA helicase B n=1 Tax=Octodon degus TaxID=10160 RepID=A0A6P6EIA9_OCTDE|nr:DNA helicase B [Octodon degus]